MALTTKSSVKHRKRKATENFKKLKSFWENPFFVAAKLKTNHEGRADCAELCAIIT